MHKTLHKSLTKKYSQPHTFHDGSFDDEVRLVSLMRDMKGYLQDAKDNLLQPRPEAVVFILQKIRRG